MQKNVICARRNQRGLFYEKKMCCICSMCVLAITLCLSRETGSSGSSRSICSGEGDSERNSRGAGNGSDSHGDHDAGPNPHK